MNSEEKLAKKIKGANKKDKITEEKVKNISDSIYGKPYVGTMPIRQDITTTNYDNSANTLTDAEMDALITDLGRIRVSNAETSIDNSLAVLVDVTEQLRLLNERMGRLEAGIFGRNDERSR